MKSIVSLPITKLNYYEIIFKHLSIKKYRVLFNIINKSILFSTKYYSYPKAVLITKLTIVILEIEIIFMVTQKNILLYQNLKNCEIEKIDNFLKILKKIL